MKKILQISTLVLLLVFMVACSDQTKEDSSVKAKKETSAVIDDKKTDEVINIAVPKAPPALPLLRMKENHSLGKNVDINISTWEEPESLIAMVQGDEHDMFAFPLTVISKLYNKGMDVKLMNVNTWGVASFLTTDKNFKSWSDLKGKTVYVTLQSSPPDILTQYFLKEAGLEVGKDVTINYASKPEIAQLLISGKAQYATLIEPEATKVTMENPKAKIAFSFEDEWKRVNNTDTMIANAGIGAKDSFISKNPDLMKKFQEEYKKALNWTLKNPKEAGILAEKHLGLDAQLIEKAIPNMGLNYKSAEESKEELSMLYKLLFNFDPKTIGGNIPNESMYYQD
ncbi:MAG: ABC transporter substrate-binding protein [Peptostreptococcus sp.]|uniref:ABC transporter substrate-binding protein n=1 Tax=Peptostreptococcus sp. TaxID=1262 RepID=UPI002FCC4578